MNRLHRVFNKDPQPYQVMFVSSTVGGVLDINADGLTITHRYATVRVDFGEKTLNQVMVEINNKPYLTATLRQPTYSSMLAKGLLPSSQQDLEDGRIYMASSIFYNEMQVYAGQLQQQANMLEYGEKQLYFHSATEEWLDFWAREYFGNPRKKQEPDSQYAPRVVAEIIKLTQNNKAMEVLLDRAIPSLDVEIVDAPARTWGNRDYHGEFDAVAEIDVETISETTIKPDFWIAIENTAAKVKAAGTRLKTIALHYKLTCHAPIFAAAGFMGEKITVYPWELEKLESTPGPQYFAAATYMLEDITIKPLEA